MILSVMKKIAINMSPSPDRIFMKSIKNATASSIIAVIMNRMIKTSYIPDILKEARIIFIHKGGESLELDQWRPITISSVLRRVISKTLDSLMRDLIDLNPYQRGFLMTPGTFININIVDGILRTSVAKKQSACLVFLDVSKAFDSVGHEHLLSTIEHSQLPHPLQRLLMNMLTNNTTRIQINGKQTEKLHIKRGVMQGDPVSPFS